MSKHCTSTVKKAPKGYRYEVHCGGEVVACGSRSSKEIAHIAGEREKSVFQKIQHGSRPAAKKTAAKKTAKRRAAKR
jgi:hypothetical protein